MKRIIIIMLAMVMAATVSVTPGCKGGVKNGKKESKPKMARNTLATAEATVRAYLDLDGQGNRLTSKTWPKVLPYISWKEEAGWDKVTVISGYEVKKTDKKSDGLSNVTVNFDVQGTVASDYQSSRHIETVMFVVKKTDAGWKITDPDTFRPHVLINPMITHLEETKDYELAQRVQTGGGH